ncbi:hypothetical protein O3G_MSEX002539 [Manduca sexta]|uniref:Intraflagellar transport protein 122 homolog n=1 Tax=Manduca sexta TaxID=7130 RepID=A0A921YNU2_MANSE|nr:hypothetical protein O3G_MSEX002539 [Manduca sexta]KAG6442847.1 hypothetical protein O3G_MSEX002539 [Manduca sexta]
MRTLPKWVNKIHEADKIEFSSVHAICFSPDGTQLVVGAGEKLMVYDPRDGALVQLLQAHKGAVHAVSYCGDGKKFASGSADKNVIIWTSKMEGILKYSHSESIQCIAYNPVTFHLASCAVSDFAFWSTDVKAVQKYRVSGRITSCAWSHNGQYLAIGLACGLVSIRDKTGEETNRITRESGVWAVAFLKSTLIITDWTETISFYNVQGQQVCKDRNIGIAALSVTLLGGLVLVGGVGGWAVLTSEGVSVINTPQEWVWAIAPSPTFNTVEENVSSVSWNSWCEELLGLSGSGVLSIKAGSFPPATQPLIGSVVGFQESVELLQLKTRASGSGEARDDEVSPLCWRCRRHASPLCAARCPHCGHEMVHSLATHEILPLVEFVPAEGITNEEAMDLIERSPLPEKSEDTSSEGNAEILRIEHDVDAYDPFQEKVEEDDDSKVVTCSRASLLQLSPAYVVIVQRPQLPPRFYRNMLPELPATMCPHCYNLFYLEDYEIQLVTKGHCPFCRHPMEEPRANDDEDDSLLNDSNSSTPNSPSTGQNSWR